MLYRDDDAEGGDSKPIELASSALRSVAGGSPTLPLPPPADLSPDPVPSARAFLW